MNLDPHDECDELLQTLKFNPKDLKGLKKILPKSNYEDEVKYKKTEAQDQKNGTNNLKSGPK